MCPPSERASVRIHVFAAARRRTGPYAIDLPALGWRHRRHYDMRSTFITLAIEDGADPEILEARVTHTKKSRSAFDGYHRPDRGAVWERVCAEVAKLRISRGASQGALAAVAGAGSDGASLPDSLQSAAVRCSARKCWEIRSLLGRGFGRGSRGGPRSTAVDRRADRDRSRCCAGRVRSSAVRARSGAARGSEFATGGSGPGSGVSSPRRSPRVGPVPMRRRCAGCCTGSRSCWTSSARGAATAPSHSWRLSNTATLRSRSKVLDDSRIESFRSRFSVPLVMHVVSNG
jgi:hypothetical protein